ncbi:MAG: hydroxymethylbilane synthase [Saprospiraceae bacterium]|nr:hydroxymethylbilane synthase [Saprospiraceae bacterium]
MIIGTRGSKLALWQANDLKNKLVDQGVDAVLRIIKTKGDHLQHLTFDKIEGKGFFTRELEEALISEEVDVAVHSMKDLPTDMDSTLTIGGVSERADPADWLIIRPDAVERAQLLSLRKQAVVGTSSNRRKAQLIAIRPDLEARDIRGNVPTRLKKMYDGEVDAVILAAAGLTRLALDLSGYRVVKLHPREFVPAPAQGVMAYQIKRNRADIHKLIRQVHQPATAILTNVERTILRELQGGCHLPLGVYCEVDDLGYYHVWAAYAPTISDELQRVNVSYSTVEGLAASVVKKLKNI